TQRRSAPRPASSGSRGKKRERAGASPAETGSETRTAIESARLTVPTVSAPSLRSPTALKTRRESPYDARTAATVASRVRDFEASPAPEGAGRGDGAPRAGPSAAAGIRRSARKGRSSAFAERTAHHPRRHRRPDPRRPRTPAPTAPRPPARRRRSTGM